MDKNETGPGFAAMAGRVVLLLLTAVGALVGVSFIAGFLSGSSDANETLSSRDIVILTAGVLFVLGCLYGGWRAARSLRAAKIAAGPATPRESRNHVVMAVASLLGAAISIILILHHSGPASTPLALFDGPLSPAVAVVLALLVGIITPALSIYWHLRVIDEQEAAAYNKGALIAMYAFWVGAPVWWLLWKGGLVSVPDGVLIYVATVIIAVIVWLWAKYR
ncbi:MAG: hypothetical protein JF608_01690 [Sphingomonadales bacterium]|nr:hypothetical protein [Sphingomonadales bacterium]